MDSIFSTEILKGKKKTTNPTGLLIKWKITTDKVFEAYEKVGSKADENYRIKWFGKDLDFLVNRTTDAKLGIRYRNFGPFREGIQNYDKEWDSMPRELKAIIPIESMGSYLDENHREYIPRTENPRNTEYGLYSIRLPAKYYKPQRSIEDLGFPGLSDILILRGRGSERRCQVMGGVFEIKKSTALIRLRILSDQIRID